MNTKLVKSSSNKMLDGVCGGIAETYHMDASLIRLLFVLGTLFTNGLGVLLYIIAAVVIPRENNSITYR